MNFHKKVMLNIIWPFSAQNSPFMHYAYGVSKEKKQFIYLFIYFSD